MSDYVDIPNVLLPEGLHFEWVPTELLVEGAPVDPKFEDLIRRKVFKAFGLPHRSVFPAPPSVLNAAYRQRQRNRVKRRRR